MWKQVMWTFGTSGIPYCCWRKFRRQCRSRICGENSWSSCQVRISWKGCIWGFLLYELQCESASQTFLKTSEDKRDKRVCEFNSCGPLKRLDDETTIHRLDRGNQCLPSSTKEKNVAHILVMDDFQWCFQCFILKSDPQLLQSQFPAYDLLI